MVKSVRGDDSEQPVFRERLRPLIELEVTDEDDGHSFVAGRDDPMEVFIVGLANGLQT